ncbi:MAG: FUSC family protein, partial [Candidatus Eremiobacteraeota bacterium]|nr:FUSC family protein [Candidatus Eremiobacteraeota bacterium]
LGLAAGFIMGQPRIGPLGLLAAVYFAFVSNIDNVMTYDAASFLNSSLAILVGIGVSIVLFATFFPETPVTASRRFRRQLLVHLRDLTDAPSTRSALVCYRQALYEQLGTTLSRVKDEPSIARQCIANAIAALAAAESISRLQVAVHAQSLLAGFADDGSRLLARLSQTLRNPSIWKLTKRAAEARDLCRRALSADEAKPEPENIEALEGLVVACEALGDDLLAARVLLEKMSNAART